MVDVIDSRCLFMIFDKYINDLIIEDIESEYPNKIEYYIDNGRLIIDVFRKQCNYDIIDKLLSFIQRTPYVDTYYIRGKSDYIEIELYPVCF